MGVVQGVAKLPSAKWPGEGRDGGTKAAKVSLGLRAEPTGTNRKGSDTLCRYTEFQCSWCLTRGLGDPVRQVPARHERVDVGNRALTHGHAALHGGAAEVRQEDYVRVMQ